MTKAARDLDHALDELYRQSPAEFTTKRDALAKKLKGEGDAEAAARVKAQRKPSQIAYVLNQLARQHADDLADLVDVGRELARAQRKALRGEAGHDLRDAITRQRSVVSSLTTKTAALMRELGVSPTGHLDEIASALQAALVDPAVGAQLEEGRLEKVPEAAAGFPGASPQLVVAVEPTRSEPKRQPKSEPKKQPKKQPKEPTLAAAPKVDTRAREAEARARAARAKADAKEEAKLRAALARRERARAELAARAETAGAEAAAKARIADDAEREADGNAALAKRLADEAGKLASEAKRLATEAKRIAREAEVARRGAQRAENAARSAAAGAKRARVDADRATKHATRAEARA